VCGKVEEAYARARLRHASLNVYVFTYGVIRVDCAGCNDTTRERKKKRERERQRFQVSLSTPAALIASFVDMPLLNSQQLRH